MTVETTYRRMTFNCTGGTTYDFDFPFFNLSEITVYQNDTLLEYETDYTISAVDDDYSNGARVTTVETYSSGTLEVIRTLPLVQETDLEEDAILPAETLEDELDRNIMIDQQLADTMSQLTSQVGDLNDDVDAIGEYEARIAALEATVILLEARISVLESAGYMTEAQVKALFASC